MDSGGLVKDDSEPGLKGFQLKHQKWKEVRRIDASTLGRFDQAPCANAFQIWAEAMKMEAYCNESKNIGKCASRDVNYMQQLPLNILKNRQKKSQSGSHGGHSSCMETTTPHSGQVPLASYDLDRKDFKKKTAGRGQRKVKTVHAPNEACIMNLLCVAKPSNNN